MARSYGVELQVFSGRPNPRFELRAEGARRLERMVDATLRQSHAGHPPAAPGHTGLGYRGLVVYARTAGAAWQPWLHVRAGVLTVMRGPGAGTYGDAGEIEAWLLEQADHAGLQDVSKLANSGTSRRKE